jgi:hypothetical protein
MLKPLARTLLRTEVAKLHIDAVWVPVTLSVRHISLASQSVEEAAQFYEFAIGRRRDASTDVQVHRQNKLFGPRALLQS